MRHLAHILRFAGVYFRPYWPRLVAGICFGLLFGLSNASFVWGTKTLIGRMAPSAAAPTVEIGSAGQGTVARLTAAVDTSVREALDPWLPQAGRPLDGPQFLGGLLFFPLLIAFRGLTAYLSIYLLTWVGERVVNDLRVKVLDHLTGLSLDFFNKAKIGDLLTRVNGDTGMLQQCASYGFNVLVTEPATMVSIFVALCLLDWQLTLGATIFLPLCVLPVIILGRKARKASKARVDVSVVQSSRLVEILSSIRVVKAFGLERAQVDHFRRLSAELVRHTMRGLRAKEKVNPIVETVSMFGFGLLIVYIVSRQRSVDDMVGFLTGMVLFWAPFKKLANLHVLIEQTSVGVDRLRQVLAERPTVREPGVPVRLAGFRQSLRFEQVSFAYDTDPVLHEVSLDLPIGTRLGIAGESGSGKSTLVNLLFRFYDPSAGRITLDGHDLRSVALPDLRSLMALVSQEVVVFDLTVAENIACGRPGATRPEIEAAARAAFAHEFVAALPQGYDTPIGERGITLSGGQRQRIAIARAFVRNAPILVLDEATASLDAQSEAEVQAAIERLEENRTVFCVAHRLATLARMDRIITLSRGRIVEDGSFVDLLRSGGLFADMARRQGITVETLPGAPR